jgi:ABC-2 type transport system permease protein
MNATMVACLVRKDFHFFRKHIVAYLIAGLVSIGIACMPGFTPFCAGGVLLISLLTTLGMHVPILIVLGERRHKTLPFLMSLPITPADYTWSKMAACLLIYGAIWSFLLASAIGAVLLADARHDGLVPFILIAFGGCAANAVLILASALVRDSLDKTVRAVVFWNLVLQALIFCAAGNRSIQASMGSESIVWHGAVVAFLLAELLVAAAAVAATFWLQSRKTQLI